MIKPVDIVVGRGGPHDPAQGTTDCSLPGFAGQQFYIEKVGYGTYDYDKWTATSNGWRLLGGLQFQADERFFVHFTGLNYGTEDGSYTNGFNLSRVLAALYGRIGWRQSNVPDSAVLTGTNLLAKSGRYFQDFHTLVTVGNLQKVIEEVAASDADLNTYLESIQRGIIMQCVNNVFKFPEYISQGILFNSDWNNNDTLIQNSGKFVGLMIRTPQKPNIAVQVDSISLYFDSEVTFNLYVYNDRVKAPLAVIEVTTTAHSQTLIDLPNVVLNHIGAANFGGTFYIGYYQDDIGDAKAYYENMPCGRQDIYAWSFMDADKVNAEYNFDRRHVRLTSINYGINAHVSTFYDHTTEIVKKASLFDNAIGLQMAAQMVEKILFSTRSNGKERVLRENLEGAAQLDLNGIVATSEGPGFTGLGLKSQVKREFTSIIKSFNCSPRSQTVNYVNNKGCTDWD
jgi:hypothetical protein